LWAFLRGVDAMAARPNDPAAARAASLHWAFTMAKSETHREFAICRVQSQARGERRVAREPTSTYILAFRRDGHGLNAY